MDASVKVYDALRTRIGDVGANAVCVALEHSINSAVAQGRLIDDVADQLAALYRQQDLEGLRQWKRRW